jgi:DNA-binding protein HU-beta
LTKFKKSEALQINEEIIKMIKNSLSNCENFYLRGFETFLMKHRSEKAARLI